MNLSDPLSVSIAATQTYKKALTAVQTNISNLNTEGYSRIEAKVSESGMGAGIATVTRSADAFAEKFGGDSAYEMARNVGGYLDNLAIR